jgi:hypothetical protein
MPSLFLPKSGLGLFEKLVLTEPFGRRFLSRPDTEIVRFSCHRVCLAGAGERGRSGNFDLSLIKLIPPVPSSNGLGRGSAAFAFFASRSFLA